MGNEANTNNNADKKGNIYQITVPLILCLNCYSKVPLLELILDNKIIKIKASCENCRHTKGYPIYPLEDYIQNLRKKLAHQFNLKISGDKNSDNDEVKFCLNHRKQSTNNNSKGKENKSSKSEHKGNYFCINCENWFCVPCYTKHAAKNWEECSILAGYQNSKLTKCLIHKEDEVYLCLDCKIFLCRKCCIEEHKVYNKEPHKLVNYLEFLTKDKIKARLYKYESSKDIQKMNRTIAVQLWSSLSLNEEDNPNLEGLKNKVTNANKLNLEINNNIQSLLEILMGNVSLYFGERLFNKKFIMNLITLTKLKLKYLNLEGENYEKNSQKVTDFFNKNFVNFSIEAKLSLEGEIMNQNSSSFDMVRLSSSKFCAANGRSQINIFNSTTKDHLLQSQAHTNIILCLKSIKNGKFLVSCSKDNLVKVWTYDEKEIKNYKEISVDDVAKVFDVEDVNLIGALTLHGDILLLDFEAQKLKLSKNLSSTNKISLVNGISPLKKGGFLVLLKGYFLVLDKNFELLKKVSVAEQNLSVVLEEDCGCFDGESREFVGSESGNVFVYDEKFNFISRLLFHTNKVTSIQFLPPKYLLTSSLDSRIVLWDAIFLTRKQVFSNSQFPITDMIVMNESKIVICTEVKEGYDNNLSVYKVEVYKDDNEEKDEMSEEEEDVNIAKLKEIEGMFREEF